MLLNTETDTNQMLDHRSSKQQLHFYDVLSHSFMFTIIRHFWFGNVILKILRMEFVTAQSQI